MKVKDWLVDVDGWHWMQLFLQIGILVALCFWGRRLVELDSRLVLLERHEANSYANDGK